MKISPEKKCLQLNAPPKENQTKNKLKTKNQKEQKRKQTDKNEM